MDTEFYKIMKEKLRDSELSITKFANTCGMHKATMVDFFSENIPLRPLRNATMGKLHKNLGIPYELMEEHNRCILENRKKSD